MIKNTSLLYITSMIENTSVIYIELPQLMEVEDSYFTGCIL